MRLHRLEIEGFGPFRRPQVVDFDQLAETGLFLIAGRTGAGKSSILDAVSFALYGAVPRYASGEKRLRSDHSEPDEASVVTLEFSVNDVRYRVQRSPEYQRPSRRGGDKLTKQAAEVSLHRWEDGAWVGLGARAKDVDGEHLPEVLQLTREQFQQVILLAQNRFAGFLLAKSSERQEVLRTLFGTRRFEDYAERLNERRRLSETQIAADNAVLSERLSAAEDLIVREALGPSAANIDSRATASDNAPSELAASEGPAERLRRVVEAVPRASYRAESAGESANLAEKQHDAASDFLSTERARLKQQQERATAREALATLDAQLPVLDALRAELSLADAAEPVRATLDHVATSSARRQQAEEAALDAIESWQAVAAGNSSVVMPLELPDVTELATATAQAELFASAASNLTAVVGELAASVRSEAALPQLREQHATTVNTAKTAERVVRELDDRAAELPKRRAEVERQLAELATLVATHETRERQVSEAAVALTAAQQAEALSIELRAADLAQAEALAVEAGAGATLAARIRQRLDGHAAELARDLRDGEPCAVCGSTAHPNPTTFDGDIVTDADITIAEQTKQQAAALVASTTAAATELRARVAEHNATAGGRTRAECETLHATATAELQLSLTAVQEQHRLSATRDELAAAEAGIAAERTEASAAVTAAQVAVATAQERVEVAERAQLEARAEWDTVADRHDAVAAVQHAVADLARALEEVARRAQTAAEARASLSELLDVSGFPDEAAAKSALRDSDFRSSARKQLADYDTDRDREKATLLRLELEMLPEELIDLTGPVAAAEAARAAWGAARAAQASALLVHERLAELAQSAAEAHRHIGSAAEQHAELVRLADTINGKEPNTMRMSLETFVLAAELEEIVVAANTRLDAMSAGRYRLVHSDERAARGAASGLGIDVFDSHTGRARPASSLSGGETFLASLALALGLAEVVTARAGGVRLDTLFIDEGFGSLDAETLDTAMHTLEELHSGGRTVGVISHVEAMHERIPHQLRVAIDQDGSSSITQYADSLG